jgi:hypothetical protein
MAALVMIKDMKADKTGGWAFAKFGPDGKATEMGLWVAFERRSHTRGTRSAVLSPRSENPRTM